MYSWITYKQTGNWPSPNNIPTNVTDETVKSTFEEASSTNISDHLKKFIGNDKDSNFYDSINSTIDSFFKDFISIFNISSLEGYLDELYGFIWFSQILLLIISISLLLLFLLYIFFYWYFSWFNGDV